MFTLGHTKYLVEINYNSGIQKRFWVYSFSMSDGGNKINWKHCTDANKPIDIYAGGVFENKIESIYQVGYRRGLLGDKK